MSLLDKVKSQATELAQKAQDAGKAGQAKLEHVQIKRKIDALYRDLGAAVYAQRTGAADADPAAADRLVDEIKTLEQELAAAEAGAGDTEA